MKRIINKIFKVSVYLFAVAGFVLISGYLAVRFHLTDVPGIVDVNDNAYGKMPAVSFSEEKNSEQVKGEETGKIDLSVSGLDQQISDLEKKKTIRQRNYCMIGAIGKYFPNNASAIIKEAEKTRSDAIAAKMVLAVSLRLDDNPDFKTEAAGCDNGNRPVDLEQLKKYVFQDSFKESAFSWVNTPEWESIKAAVAKDKPTIEKVASQTGIEPRLLVSNMIVEQLRLFNSEREVFKKFFEPLKILCSANKISLGVMGIKEETAIQVENNLKNPDSPFYLGKDYEGLLDLDSGGTASQRYDRLVDDKDHYYSYLYGALYLKQMMKQWKDAGYPIDYRPEIVGTLFNVGFPQSRPKPDPKVGGSEINVNERKYSFGSLAYEFYYSGELADDFPYVIN